MGKLRQHWSLWAALLVILAAVALRLQIYGDLRLSIANNDTESYAAPQEGRGSFWNQFSGRRLFTTNLLYGAFRPESGYQVLVNGSLETASREIQPTFNGIILLQNLVSILSWAVLAFVVAQKMRQPLLRMVTAFLLMAFAFTPQLADWDSVLSSESLTFSLFALQFGLLIALAFAFHENRGWSGGKIALVVLWLISVFFWTFLKDGNLYNLLIDGLALAGLLLFKSFRRIKALYFALGLLSIFFVLGWMTAGQSVRTEIQLLHVYDVNILSGQAGTRFMQDLGMPERNSPEFEAWFREHGRNAYLRFLLAHPGYVTTLYARDSLRSFGVNLQPYFRTPELGLRNALIPPGDALHPASPDSMLIDLLLLAGLWLLALQRKHGPAIVWAWLATWLYLSAHASLFITVFGDTYALTRHALPAAAAFHLFLWLFSIVLIELALLPHEDPKSPVARADS